MTQGVSKRGHRADLSNNRIRMDRWANHCCGIGRLHDSLFRFGFRKSVLTQPGPTAEVEAHQFVTRYTEGFSHFVTSMTAPVASGRSGGRVGLAPTGKAPPYHGAHHEQTFGLDGLRLHPPIELRRLRASGRKRPMAEERVQRRLAAILAADVVGNFRPTVICAGHCEVERNLRTLGQAVSTAIPVRQKA